MVTNRRSRTDCDTYADIERDLGNTNPSASQPLIPSIEDPDNESLFKWARNLTMALDEWFDVVGSVINDTTEGVSDLYDCYCLYVCSTTPGYDCAAMQDWADQAANSQQLDFLARLYNPQDWSTAPANDVPNLGSYDRDMRVDTGNVTIEAGDDGDIYDECNASTQLISDFAGGSGSGDFLRPATPVEGNYARQGWGDDFTFGGFFKPGNANTTAIFAWRVESNGASGVPQCEYQISWNSSPGVIRAQKGDDNFEHVRLEVSDAALDAWPGAGTYSNWMFIAVRIRRTDTTFTMDVWANGTYVGQDTATETNQGTLLSAWSSWEEDNSDDGPLVSREPHWGWGGNGSREGYSGRGIWMWGTRGDASDEIAEIGEAFLRQNSTYVPTSVSFDPQVGNILKVTDVVDGDAIWCPDNIYPDGAAGTVLRRATTADDDVFWDTVDETRYTKTFVQSAFPEASESAVGDLWVVKA